MELTDEDVREIYRKVANGFGNHGSFLRSFASAVVFADAVNYYLISAVARSLIQKYGIEGYAKVD